MHLHWCGCFIYGRYGYCDQGIFKCSDSGDFRRTTGCGGGGDLFHLQTMGTKGRGHIDGNMLECGTCATLAQRQRTHVCTTGHLIRDHVLCVRVDTSSVQKHPLRVHLPISPVCRVCGPSFGDDKRHIYHVAGQMDDIHIQTSYPIEVWVSLDHTWNLARSRIHSSGVSTMCERDCIWRNLSFLRKDASVNRFHDHIGC